MAKPCSICQHSEQEEIEELLLAGSESLRGLARQFGVSSAALCRHKSDHLAPLLRSAALELTEQRQRAEALLDVAVNHRSERLHAQQDRWERMRKVIQERADDMADVPSGRTGLLVRKYKQVGDKTVEEYAVDASLLRELRELEKLVAQESGGSFGEATFREAGPQIVIVIPPAGEVRPPKVIDVIGVRISPKELEAPEEASNDVEPPASLEE